MDSHAASVQVPWLSTRNRRRYSCQRSCPLLHLLEKTDGAAAVALFSLLLSADGLHQGGSIEIDNSYIRIKST